MAAALEDAALDGGLEVGSQSSSRTPTRTPASRQPANLGPCVSTTFKKVVEDPDSEAYASNRGRSTGCSFCSYFAIAFTIAAVFSALSIGFWSEMGCGDQCLNALRSVQEYSKFCLFGGSGIILVLYMLDFFFPPHLDGQCFALFKGDIFLGRSFLALAVFLMVAAAYLMADTLPTVPLITSIFLSPLALLLFRWIAAPKDVLVYEASRGITAQRQGTKDASGTEAATGTDSDDGRASFERRMHELKQLTGDQEDQRIFYKAAGYAYAAVGFLCVFVFVGWAVQADHTTDPNWTTHEKELHFIRWAAPLTVSISNFLCGLLMWLRVSLHSTYTETDEARNRLVVEAANKALGQEIMKYRMSALTEAYAGSEQVVSEQAWEKMQAKIEEYILQQGASVQRLTTIIKLLNVALLVIVGSVLLTLQFAAGDSQFSVFAQGFVASFTLVFGTFVLVAFSRLRMQLSAWLQDLPLWKSASNAASQSWARAGVLTVMLPAIPFILILSAANQQIRRCRRIETEFTTLTATIFGRRINMIVCDMWTWDWLCVLWWCYIWGGFLVVFKVAPLFLNALLAWMSDLMGDMDFGIIVVLTFAMGMFLFMLPPVPGPPIYLFGGLVIADKCPWGFWWGAGVNVFLGFFLKLAACAVQQKLIGGYLNGSQWVRQTCGVHTPLMRAIERALRKPGLSAGKVMILCGGPDWPTSVLAGILGISLMQCIIGTIPIVFAIVPLSFSGSFYLRGGVEIYARMANFMFILSAVITMGFWGGMAWAVQDEFEKNQEAITAPREEFVDLEWLDYVSAKVRARINVRWGDVPRFVLAPFVLGMIGVVMVGNMFQWRMAHCFGTFEIQQDIDLLVWFGETGLIRPLGVGGLIAAAGSALGFVVFQAWYARKTREPAAAARGELAGEEAEWKERRRQAARESARKKEVLTAKTVEDITAAQVTNLRRRLTHNASEKFVGDVECDASTDMDPVESGTSLSTGNASSSVVAQGREENPAMCV